jgi:hypothetical protein
MSTAPDEKVMLTCPGCQKRLKVPASASGKNGKCPACQAIFQVPAAQPAKLAVAPIAEDTPRFSDDDFYDFAAPTTKAASPAATSFPDLASEPPPKIKYPKPEENDSFRHEKNGIEKGVLGGIAMIAISLIWFFGGLACGILFYYPPILFIIGVYAVIKGLATGNLAGGKKKRR